MAKAPKCEGAGCTARTMCGMCRDCLTLEHNSKLKFPLPEVPKHELQTHAHFWGMLALFRR